MGSLMTQMSTHWRTGVDDMVHQVRRRLGHAPGPAGRAEPAPLAAQRDELVVAAVAAVQAQQAIRQDAAFEQGVELVLHELRQVGASRAAKSNASRLRARC